MHHDETSGPFGAAMLARYIPTEHRARVRADGRRVRRVDPDGNRGPWSEVGEFKVQLKQPDLLAPTSGASVAHVSGGRRPSDENRRYGRSAIQSDDGRQ